MDSRPATVLLLLLLLMDWGHAEEPGSHDGGEQDFLVSEQTTCPGTISPISAETCALGLDVLWLLKSPFKGKWLLSSYNLPLEATPFPMPSESRVFAHLPSLPQEENNGSHLPQHAETPGSLLRSLLQAIERPGRSSAFLFQPQRFGRNAWRSWSKEQLSPRAGEFWSLAAPQRFGKK
ncbi:pro-FMRFamide-related neuropeptide FF isoform X1 [Nannospalax galili]|uniref:pro-FMRFamide-related neuropeptide FF isoform X1 n=1 Tax=Nannospalax galili TaxID=1026970 RepID=UPI0004ED66CE|nr:pro-FMRFamide-related neuropeptide FF isoform X1 [Nannospalax galili]